jgi:hypothetical protein
MWGLRELACAIPNMVVYPPHSNHMMMSSHRVENQKAQEGPAQERRK